MPKYSRVTKFQPIIEEKIDEGWSKTQIYEHLRDNYTINFTYRNLLLYMDKMQKRKAVLKENLERSETELATVGAAFNNNAKSHIQKLNGDLHKYHEMIQEVMKDRELLENADFDILDFEENMKQMMAVTYLGANKFAPGNRFNLDIFERMSRLYMDLAKTYNLILSDTKLVNPYTLNLNFDVKKDGKANTKPLADIEKEAEDSDPGLDVIDVEATEVTDKEFDKLWKQTEKTENKNQ